MRRALTFMLGLALQHYRKGPHYHRTQGLLISPLSELKNGARAGWLGDGLVLYGLIGA